MHFMGHRADAWQLLGTSTRDLWLDGSQGVKGRNLQSSGARDSREIRWLLAVSLVEIPAW